MADRNSTHRSKTNAAPARGRTNTTRRPSQGQKTTGKAAVSRAADRKVLGASHATKSAPRSGRPSQQTPRKATNVSSGTKRARARSSAPRSAGEPIIQGSSSPELAATFNTIKERVLANRVITAVLVIAALLILGLLFDTAANWGKAYGNVSINGMSVAGMTADDMHKALDENFGSKLSGSQVTVYASEEARQHEGEQLAAQSDEATAEQISFEESQQRVTQWTTDGATLQATLPYDEVIAKALEAGHKGGPFGRLALAFTGEDIPLSVVYNDSELDKFASTIDSTVGDARKDATVEIESGKAHAVDGHDGTMVDRKWLADRMSDVMLGKNGATYVIAEVSNAPSRTTREQAEAMSSAINKALEAGATFSYHSNDWTADSYELGNWTRVDVVESGDGYDLKASINQDVATSSIVKNVSLGSRESSAKAGNIVVDFEKGDNGVIVHTSGTGEVPEVVPAIEAANEELYGDQGIAWSAATNPNPVKIEIGESNAPETLGFEQAVDLGVITVIGEFTTEFSNEEGTENRNHNIKLVSDIINDTICESNGGQWSFNTHSGDTNLDPPFASAGSIVNGEYVDSIGGGICQVATTVFNAVYEAGLDVVQRRNHSLYIASYPTGRDVGVSYPDLDFVWANQLPSDVLLRVFCTDTSVTAQLYSVYTGYQVETIEGQWEEGAKYQTEYVEDPELEKGDSYLKTVGEDGSRITVTRKVTDKSGAAVSETEFESNYDPKNEVYAIGAGTDTSGLGHDSSASGSTHDDDDLEEEELGDEENELESTTSDEVSASEGSSEEY